MLVTKSTDLEKNTKLQVIHVPHVLAVLLLGIKLARQLFVAHPAQIPFGKKESAVIMSAQATTNLRSCVQEEMDLFVHQIMKLIQISAYLKLLKVKIKNWKSCTMVTAALKVSLQLHKILYTLPPSKQGEFYLRLCFSLTKILNFFWCQFVFWQSALYNYLLEISQKPCKLNGQETGTYLNASRDDMAIFLTFSIWQLQKKDPLSKFSLNASSRHRFLKSTVSFKLCSHIYHNFNFGR